MAAAEEVLEVLLRIEQLLEPVSKAAALELKNLKKARRDARRGEKSED